MPTDATATLAPDGNVRKIREYLDRGVDEGAQLVMFPELAINGYPPEDLLLKSHFLAAGRRALDDLALHVRDTVALVGPEYEEVFTGSLRSIRTS